MDRSYLEINIPNLVSVTILALAGLWIISLLATLGGKYISKQATV